MDHSKRKPHYSELLSLPLQHLGDNLRQRLKELDCSIEQLISTIIYIEAFSFRKQFAY